jgi:hypothetical protein
MVKAGSRWLRDPHMGRPESGESVEIDFGGKKDLQGSLNVGRQVWVPWVNLSPGQPTPHPALVVPADNPTITTLAGTEGS